MCQKIFRVKIFDVQLVTEEATEVCRGEKKVNPLIKKPIFDSFIFEQRKEKNEKSK